MEGLNVTIEHQPAVVRPRGDLDLATAYLLERALDEALLRPEVSYLEVDMSGVPFMDCSGLRALIHAKVRLSKEGGTLILMHVTPRVDRLLSILSLDHRLDPIQADRRRLS
ncbi:hypothetical protein GCM10023194_32410 [Planotetraspora phitsanulokensis]|uniref:Anti-sigma factor antagonist n=1 Tax=Planotetraspora phitsanulokensis TaxID=575192 RepID=A0A8J3TZK4_9ACTN|nr:STAS domain-containing protein [Planotetraspora phitsanulokensis]GII35620.1 hypothetical protein Pph01_06230 [Planotetraspora phitsanulokensis]